MTEYTLEQAMDLVYKQDNRLDEQKAEIETLTKERDQLISVAGSLSEIIERKDREIEELRAKSFAF